MVFFLHVKHWAESIANLVGTPQVGKISLSSISKKIEQGLKINYNGLEINSESFKMKNEYNADI